MKRKKFIEVCGFSCLGVIASSVLLQGCVTTKYINADINGSFLEIPESAFKDENSGTILKHVIVENDSLQYPIVIFLVGENHYQALNMRCTHQGTELQVFGDRLQCPAHGSEFSNSGDVQNGPADEGLRVFPVTRSNNFLKVDLS